MSIGERIRSERERLGFNQPDFAALAKAKKHAQIKWEKGETFPNAATLSAWLSAGADVLFILTGKTSSSALSPDESTLLQMYRAATPATKGAALGALLGAQQGIDQVIHSLSSREVQIPAVDNTSTAAPKPARKPATKTSK